MPTLLDRTRNAFPVFDGRKLRTLRRKLGISPSDFVARLEAETGGTSIIALHRLEDLERHLPRTENSDRWSEPRFSEVLAICRILGCSPEDLASTVPVYVIAWSVLARARERAGMSWGELALRSSVGLPRRYTAAYLEETLLGGDCRSYGIGCKHAARIAAALGVSMSRVYVERGPEPK